MEKFDEQWWFSEFISSGRILPKSIVKKYDAAIKKGGSCPTNKELQELTAIDLHHHMDSFIDFSSLGLGSKDDFNLYEDVAKVGGLVEQLIRYSLKTRYGWGLPTKESVNKVVEFLKNDNSDELIEFGAGSGLWSAVLSKKLDIAIKSFDLELRNDTPKAKFFNVLNDDALKYIDSNKSQTVLMVWPDPSEVPFKVLQKMSLRSNLIVCGPPFVTADDDFYKYLDKEFELLSYAPTGGFAGNDEIFILKKVNPKINHDNFFENKRNENKVKIRLKR